MLDKDEAVRLQRTLQFSVDEQDMPKYGVRSTDTSTYLETQAKLGSP